MEKKELNSGVSASEPPRSDNKWCQTALKGGYLCPDCKRPVAVEDRVAICKCGSRSKVPAAIERGKVQIHDMDLPPSVANSLSSEYTIAIDYETGCPNPLHSIPCAEKCALDPSKVRASCSRYK
jgi:hypothetical protein